MKISGSLVLFSPVDQLVGSLFFSESQILTHQLSGSVNDVIFQCPFEVQFTAVAFGGVSLRLLLLTVFCTTDPLAATTWRYGVLCVEFRLIPRNNRRLEELPGPSAWLRVLPTEVTQRFAWSRAKPAHSSPLRQAS